MNFFTIGFILFLLIAAFSGGAAACNVDQTTCKNNDQYAKIGAGVAVGIALLLLIMNFFQGR
jgi:hypothetical protein